MSKVKTAVIFGAGYVLGAQAGRARYEQLKQQATRLAEHPRTQELARQAREKVSARVPATLSRRRGVTGDAAADGSPVTTTPVEPAIDLTEPVEPSRPSHL